MRPTVGSPQPRRAARPMPMGPWRRRLPLVQAHAPALLQPWINEVSLKGLQLALVVATVVPWAIGVWAASQPSHASAIWCLLLLQAVVLVNVVWHLVSFQSVGTSTLQSRACAGVANGTFIFCLPGSNGAVKDGWDKLIRWQLDSRHMPCNMVELMPRLLES